MGTSRAEGLVDPREAGQQRLFSAALGPPAVPGSLLASEAQRDQVLGVRRGLQEPRVTDAPGPSRPHPHGTSGAPGARSPSRTPRGACEWLPGAGRSEGDGDDPLLCHRLLPLLA